MSTLETFPDVLTPSHLSKILQLTPSTIRKLAARGDLPGKQIVGRWRFFKPSIIAWLSVSEPAPFSDSKSGQGASPPTSSPATRPPTDPPTPPTSTKDINNDADQLLALEGVAGQLAAKIIQHEEEQNNAA